MSNSLKRRFALAGISSRCFTCDDMEMLEQFKTTNKYKKWKKKKSKEYKKQSKKVGKNKAFKDVYGDCTPSYMKLQFNKTSRLRLDSYEQYN